MRKKADGRVKLFIKSSPPMKGSFNEKSLLAYAESVAEKLDVDFAEGEVYDFTRCVRANGSFYGTSGRCRQGSPAGPKEEEAPKGRQGRSDLPTAADKKSALDAIRNEAAKRAAAGDEKGVDAAIKAYARLAKAQTKEGASKGSSGINLAKVQAAKAKLAADKKANGGKRLDRIQEEQRLERNRVQRENDKKLEKNIEKQEKAKKPEAPLRGQNLANKMMDHVNITNRVAANHGGAIRTKAAKEEHAAELKKAGVPDRATLTAALKAQRDEGKKSQ